MECAAETIEERVVLPRLQKRHPLEMPRLFSIAEKYSIVPTLVINVGTVLVRL